jgi:hypothetical protein
MKYAESHPYADPERAARRIVEIASTVEPAQDGRIYVELINGTFLFKDKGSPAEYGAGKKLAIERGCSPIAAVLVASQVKRRIKAVGPTSSELC